MRDGYAVTPMRPGNRGVMHFRRLRKDNKLTRRFISALKRHLVMLLALWGALWGALTFLYIHVLQPRTAPVNISLGLELKKVSPVLQASAHGKQLVAVEMQLTATNPSSREIYLLPNIWVAYGYQVDRSAPRTNFEPQVNRTFGLQHDGQRPVERYGESKDGVIVAGGTLFNDSGLKPDEKVIRKLVFHVPKDLYDVVEVWTAIPTTSKPANLVFEWRVKGADITANARCRDKQRCTLEDRPGGRFVDDTLELQQSSSRVAISLWE